MYKGLSFPVARIVRSERKVPGEGKKKSFQRKSEIIMIKKG